MEPIDDPGDKSPDGAVKPALEDWRIDWQNIDERQRARHRRDAAGASRDIGASLLVGGL